jgi:capsule polysaccharide export protein KpsE/RkpR
MSLSVDVPIRRRGPELPENSSGMLVPPESPQAEDTSLAYLRLLWSYRRALSRVALYALLASTLLAFLIPVQYESTARLMPPEKKSGSGLAMAAAALSGTAGGLGEIASDLLGGNTTSEISVGILASRTVQDKLVRQFELQKLYSTRRVEDARKRLANRTTVVVDRKSQIISITVTDRSPQRAAAMAQAYTDELNRLLAELNTSSAHRERVFLEERLRAVSQDLEAAERDFSQFASKNTAIDIKEQGKAMVEGAAMLQGQLIAAQSEYEGLKQIYTDNNVRVRSLKARIDELQHQLEKLGGKGESTSSVASGAENDGLYPSIRKLPLLGVTFADLYRRTKIQEAVLETLTKEYEMAKVQEVKELPTVKVLDAANIPERKSFPPRMLIMFFGTLLALTVAMGWIFGKEVWQGTDANDPRKIFAQEVFSTISAQISRLPRSTFGRRLVNSKVLTWGRRRKVDDFQESK